jgi:hypothetical protein
MQESRQAEFDMSIRVEVSVGEFIDKLTILEIKRERMRDPARVANVRRELEVLNAAWVASGFASHDIGAEQRELRAVNERLWEIEDQLRALEAEGRFDARFVELARLVYHTNDQRAAIKQRINLRLGSSLIEEKQHPAYPHRS